MFNNYFKISVSRTCVFTLYLRRVPDMPLSKHTSKEAPLKYLR